MKVDDTTNGAAGRGVKGGRETGAAVATAPSIGGYLVYHGRLHGRTGVSDGVGTPTRA